MEGRSLTTESRRARRAALLPVNTALSSGPEWKPLRLALRGSYGCARDDFGIFLIAFNHVCSALK